jgi:hypothetical protein
MASQVSQGAVLKIATVVIGQISTISGPGASAEKIDVTSLSDTSKAYLRGIVDGGDMTFEIFYDATASSGAPNHDDITAAMISGTAQAIEITFSDTANTVSFSAYVTGFDIAQGVDEALTASVTLGITGAITYPT